MRLRRPWFPAMVGTCVLALGGSMASAAVASNGSSQDSAHSGPVDRPNKDDKTCDYDVMKNVAVPMRDGVELRADVYRPKVNHDVPVTLVRTQYDKNGEAERAKFFAEHCYIAVAQDVRGTYSSGGKFYEFRNEPKDGYDTVEWAADLPGSNGKVGMWGTSYVGATQWMAGKHSPPHLTTIIPRFTASSYYDGWSYQGGAWSLAFEEAWPGNTIVQSGAASRGNVKLHDEIQEANKPKNLKQSYWQLPISQYEPFHPESDVVAPYFYDWIDHSTNDKYWKRWAPRQYHENIEVPVLGIAGWYDVFLKGGFENFNEMRRNGGTAKARKNQHIIIGPWTHTNASRRQPWASGKAPENRVPWSASESMDYGEAAEINEKQVQLRWFDHWLKGEDRQQDMPPVQYFLMGANKWKTAQAWPLKNTRWTNFYLNSGGNANSRHGDGTLVRQPTNKGANSDSYTYNPRNPVQSNGGHSCCFAARTPMGPGDQRKSENRDDVLVFDTPKLKKSMEVTGPIKVTLFAKTDVKDTDFTAKLVDVHPNGKAVQLNDGIQRARFRASLSDPKPVKPGKVYKYNIKVWPTSNLFKEGHKIRLDISSSNFPMYARNTNTGHKFGQDDESDMKKAHQVIYHNDRYPSRMRLPIIPANNG